MKYIDADKLEAKVREMLSDAGMKDWPITVHYLKNILTFIESQEREVIPNNEILRKAKRDMFYSHESAAVEEAKRRYTSPYAPECCHLISTYDIITRIQTAFVEGVIWKENEEIKEENK